MPSLFNLNRRKLIMMMLGAIDIIASLGTLLVASLLVNKFTVQEVVFNSEFLIVSIIVLLTWIVLLKTTQLAKIPRTSTSKTIFTDFLKLTLFGGIILLVSDWFIKLDSFPALALFVFCGLNLLVLFTIRIITFKTVKHYRANGHNTRNVVVIGDSVSSFFIEKLITQKEWGFNILYVISDSDQIKNQFRGRVKVHPKSVNIKSLLKFDMVDELICFDCLNNPQKLQGLIEYCSNLGVTVRTNEITTIPELFRTNVEYFDKIPLYTIENNPVNRFHHVTKLAVEIGISLTMLFLLSPALLVICAIIKLESKGPVVFKQERVGRRGRKFYIYKFRTMVINAEELKEKLMNMNESDGPTFKIKKDPRITTVGRILRKTNLDEIPQLFNVIKGEMSLVGPRPPLASEVEKYEEWQLKRLAVKPGLTCTWQIVPNRNDVKFDRWVEMDIQYIDNWSLKTDVELFFKTFKTVLFARGA